MVLFYPRATMSGSVAYNPRTARTLLCVVAAALPGDFKPEKLPTHCTYYVGL